MKKHVDSAVDHTSLSIRTRSSLFDLVSEQSHLAKLYSYSNLKYINVFTLNTIPFTKPELNIFSKSIFIFNS